MSTRTSARAVAFARLAIAALLFISLPAGLHAQTCTAPVIVQQGGPVPVCPGSAVTLDAGPGWMTYSWSNGATGQTMTVTPMATTSYTVTVTDANSCTVTSQPYEVVVEPVTLVVNAPLEVCPVSVEEASVAPPPGGGSWVSVSWTIEHGWFNGQWGQSPNATGETVSFSADESGEPAVLTVTAYDGHCSTVETKTIGIREIAPPVINAPLEICPMGAQATVSVAPPPGGGDWMSVMWEITNGQFYGPMGASTVTSGSSANFSADNSGLPVVLHVQVWDGEYCSSEATTTVGLRVIAPPVISAPLEICPMGASATASVAPPAEGGAWYSVSWEITNGQFFGQWGPSAFASGTEVSFTADSSGQPVVLTVRAYDSEYCMSESTKTVGIRSIAPPVISAPLEICPQGASATAMVAPPAEGGAWYNVSWEISHGSFQGPTGPSPFASGTEVSFYADDSGLPVVLSVRAYDGEYCVSESTKTVGIRTIAPPVISAPLEVCPQGASATAMVAPPAEGGAWYNVSWEITHGSFQGPFGPSAFASGTEVSFYADNSGQPVVLSVRAYDGQYCHSEATNTVGLRTIEPPVISAPLEVCPNGASATAMVAPPAEGGAWYNVSWEIAHGSFSGLNGPSAFASGTEVSFYADGSGPVVLTVHAYDGQYCTSQATRTVGLRAIAPPVISAPASICAGGPGTASIAPPAEGGAWFNVAWTITNGTFTGGSTFANGENVSYFGDGSGNPVTLSVQAYDGEYCSSQATKTVAISTPTATITAGGPTTFCPGVGVQLTASAGASYSWSTGATTQSIWTDDSGDYTVTVTDANGCSATSAPITLTARDVVVPEIVTIPTYCAGSGNQTATASGGAPVSYLWQILFGATIVGPNNGPTLTYTSSYTSHYMVIRLITTDAQGCTVVSPLREVPISNVEAPVLNYSTAVCANGTGWVQVYTPTAGSTWQWSITNGVIDSIVNNQTGLPDPNGDRITFHPTVAGGNVSVTSTETNAAGCSKSSTVQVPVTAVPQIDFTITPACPGGPGSAVASSNPPFGHSFAWALTNATITSGQGARTLNYVATGSDPVTIALTITNNNSWAACSNTVTKVSPVQTIAPPTINKPAMACPGATHSASVSSGLYDQVTWTLQNANVVSTSATSVSYTAASTTGDIVITAVVRKGTCTNTATVTVPIADPVITAPASICPSGTVTVTYPSGYLGLSRTYQHAFYVSENSNSITVRPDGSGQPIEVTIGFQVTVSANSCWVYRTKVIPIVQTETPVIEWNVPANFCVGMSGSATITNREYSSYAWTVTGGTITGPANGPTINFVWSEQARNFTASVNVVDERGCAASGGSASPQVNLVSFIWSSRGNKLCPGQTTTLSASQPNMDSYLWSTGETTPTIVVGTTGTYTVTTTKNGCSLLSEPQTITVVNPVVNVTPSGTSYCSGSSRTLTATYSNGTGRIPWFELHAASNGAYLGGNYSGVFNINSTSSQGYFVRVIEDLNTSCVTNSSTVNFTVNPLPSAFITPSGPTTFCQGGSVTLTAPAGMSSYSWSNGATTQAITVSQSGNYTVTVTNSNGCTASSSRSVTVNPLPVSTITPSGPTQFCEGGSVTLTASAGQAWLWSTGATTQSINVTQAGAYTVRVTTNGCSTTSAATNVVVDARPSAVVTADGPTTFCEGGSVTLTAPESSSYSWSTGATTRSITVDASGAYSVTVTNAAGCSATSTPVAVTENALPATPVIAAGGPTTFCQGGSVTLTAPAGFTYLWSTGATMQSINVSASGDYSVSVTNASGCTSSSAPVTVTVNAIPAATVTPSGPTTFCAGGSVTLTASAGSSYLWSNGATTQSIVVNASGNYSVTVTNANGCSATSAATGVTVNALPAAAITAGGPTTFCEGGSVTLSASAGSSYLWSNGATTQSIVVNASGSYSVTVTNANGCSATSAATGVTVNALPVAAITASGPTTFCAGGSVTLTASAGASYLWSNGATTQSIEVSASGSYSVMVTNANGCSATSAATSVTANALPSATVTASGPTTFCEGGSVTLTASAGASYLWSNGATTQSIDVYTGGSYSVTVTSAAGCSATSAATSVTVDALPAPAITAEGPTAFCEGGSVMLTASAGSAYLWSTGATTQSIDVTASGSYSVTVTNAAGCSATSAATTVTVHALPAATITPSGPTTFCEGGSVTLTAGAGSSYLWSNGATTQSIVVSASGNYSVTVTNANDCSATSAATSVTVNALPVATVSASGPTAFCAGGSVTLTASAGSSYLWSNGATTPSIVVTAAGDYSVTVTNANGCSSTSAATSVTVNALPAATITAGGPTTFCEGGSVTLTAGAGASYLWSTGATTQSIEVTASGSYSVTVTNGNGCSATSTATSVTVNPLPTPSISAGGPTTFCQGGSVTLTGQGTPSGAWYRNGSLYSTQGSIVVTSSATFVYRIQTAAGCTADSAPTVVTVNPLPAINGGGGNGRICANETVYWQLDNPTAGATIVWTVTGGVIVSGQNEARLYYHSDGVAASVHLDALLTNASGCTKTFSYDIPVDRPTPAITADGPTAFCTGGTVTLTATTAPAGWEYRWSNGATTQSITVANSGTYTAHYYKSGCHAPYSEAVTVTVNALPAATITAGGPTTFCEGGSVTLTASAGSSYLWSSGATTQSINVTTGGSYSVTVTSAAGCSATSAATAVTVNTLPSATITPSGPTTFCAGGSVTLTASAGSSYLWSNGATTSSINVTSSGSYSVTVTNAAGCSATSASTAVTVNALPAATITPSGPTTFCTGGSVTLTASAGASYLWSNGATTSSIDVTSSGNYSVTVTNAAGCSATSASTAVTVNALPAATITPSGPTTFCAGGSITLTASAGSSYLWSNGATTSSINVNSSGNYSVTVTNAAGCSTTSASTAVTVNALPSATITPSGPTTFCTGGSVTLTASAGSSYLWSNGATTQAINVTTSGNYSVTVTNAAGCSSTSAATAVTVNTLPSATITPSGPTTFCAGGSVTLTASAGSSYLWSNGATTQAINVTTSGNYSVTVTNAAGCSTTSAATSVTVNALPAATISPSGPTTFCAGGSVTLTASAGSSYLWSNGATTQAINVTSSGSYSVTVTNAAGCSAASTATTVTVNAAPTATITPSGPTTFCAGGSVTLTASAGSSYLWSNGATTQAINVTSSGNYSVTVTNAAGCSAASTATTVTVNAAPTATITPSGPTTFCAGGSVTLTASAGASYLWSTGATTQSINVTTGGNYTVTVTNAAGCSAISAPRSVSVNANPSTPAITAGGPTTFCAGGSVTLSAPAGFTYLWSTGATTQSINVTTTDNYTVTVTNASGCSALSAPKSVTVNAATAISQHPQSITIPKGTGTTLTVIASGSGTLTYQWYKGTSPSTTQPISGATGSSYPTGNLTKGTYKYWVRVTGTCGVMNSNTATVTAN